MSLFQNNDEPKAEGAADTTATESTVEMIRSEATTRRTDRPATAMLRQQPATSPALEAVESANRGAEATARLRRPVRNLSKLFQLIMGDLATLPVLSGQMLMEGHHQLAQIEQALENLEAAEAETIDRAALEALRAIRTPLANLQGVLGLVLDDRDALPRPVIEMLLLACEQLDKLAATGAAMAEQLNLAAGMIAVRYTDTALEQVLELAIRNARDEGFESELVTANQVAADTLPAIEAARSQCLEALVRHALLDTMPGGEHQPVGLFVYREEDAAGRPTLAIEIHDRSDRQTDPAPGTQGSLNAQIVREMTQALQGEFARTIGSDGETVTVVRVPCAPLGGAAIGAEDSTAAALPAEIPAEETTAMTNAYRGVALLSADRRLPTVIADAVAQQWYIERLASAEALVAALEQTWLPTVFVDSDLLIDADETIQARFSAAMERIPNPFILHHAEADADSFTAQFPGVWDDDLLTISGMLEQPFQPGTKQENLVLLTGDHRTEMRPWRKLLAATGHGAMWWPAERTIQAERLPAMLGSIVVLTTTTRALPAAQWQALAQLKVRDRRVLVLTGSDTCQLPGARGWDIYRPNLQACDDTLRRYILFNSPARQAPRVAVIEDDLLMRKLLGAAVEDQAKISEIATVAEALETLRTQSFDVILLDLYLPDGSGLRILEALKSDPRLQKAARTPIVCLTAATDLDINRQALELGAAEVLAKPVPMQVLRQKIALLTRQNRSGRISGAFTIPTLPEPAHAAAPAAEPAPAPIAQARSAKIINLRQAQGEAVSYGLEAGIGD